MTHCEWDNCPGSDEELIVREDGDWHPECLAEWMEAEAAYWRRALAPEIAEVDQRLAYDGRNRYKAKGYVDDVTDRADNE